MAEQRRTNSYVCRAVVDGDLEVAAHAGRDVDGPGVGFAHRADISASWA